VQIGIDAPKSVPVHRREVYDRIKQSEGSSEAHQGDAGLGGEGDLGPISENMGNTMEENEVATAVKPIVKTDSIDQRQLRDSVHRLLEEAKEVDWERRTEKRVPFFQPVTITTEGDERRQFSCFSKDIFPTGMGLLHYAAIEPGEVVLTIPSKSSGQVRIRAEIVRCRPCGEGWYTSGARFISVAEAA
jgi:hypothetical protein